MTVKAELEDLSRRSDLTEQIIEVLRRAPGVEAVECYGSLASGRADRYSDIDLVVRIRDLSDRTFAEMVPALVEPVGPRLVDGWGLSTLPDIYVRTLYFHDYPLFWHVDIGCLRGRLETHAMLLVAVA